MLSTTMMYLLFVFRLKSGGRTGWLPAICRPALLYQADTVCDKKGEQELGDLT